MCILGGRLPDFHQVISMFSSLENVKSICMKDNEGWLQLRETCLLGGTSSEH